MYKIGKLGWVLGIVGAILPNLALAKSNTQEMMLKNGIKVIVRSDQRAPIAVFQILYKVGSFDELEGSTGLSHALEHMMFKGTKLNPGDSFSRQVTQMGGVLNAYTTEDYTGYYEIVPVKELDKVFALEADRMANLSYSEEEFKKEIEVVKEERRLRYDDKPISVTHELFTATAYMTGPYHHQVIGWMSDLNQMTNNDALEWYKRFYKPSNATIVVVGDVDPKLVFSLAKKHFDSIKGDTVQRTKVTSELEQSGERRIDHYAISNIPYLMVGYKVPSLVTAENKTHAYALELMSAILSSGASSRLSQEMVRKDKIAASCSANYDLLKRGTSLFTLSGTPAKGKDMAQLEKAFESQIQKMQTQLVSSDELQRAKNKIKAHEVFLRDSMSDTADQIGLFELTGATWQKETEYFDEISKITAKDIQEVAIKYFQPLQRTTGRLLPKVSQENQEG